MTGTPTIILAALAMLLAGCESTGGWQTVAEAKGEWRTWTDEAGNQWRVARYYYPGGIAFERVERMEPE